MDGITCVANAHTCENGTPTAGSAATAGAASCSACDGGYRLDGITCVANTYTCKNGIESTEIVVDGTHEENRCASCANGYRLDGIACIENAYVCANGTATVGNAPTTEITTSCTACDGGYRMDGGACAANVYTCTNGSASTAIDPTGTNGDIRCSSCNASYSLTAILTCSGPDDIDGDGVPNATDPDDDNDGSLDGVDVDDDNDGLIEIATLQELHNMRHNLTGTTYDDEAADTTTGDAGSTTGGPTAATANCTTAVGGVYLCGYELVADLDFDVDGNNRTWNAATYALDTADSNTAYFPITSVTAGGWLPIGGASGQFAAIFEGNGNTIRNLAVRSAATTYGGLFARTTASAQIRNITLANTLIDVANGSTAVNAGSLTGENNGAIIAAVATDGAVRIGATASVSAIGGGLVGVHTGTIIASHSTGTVTGGAVRDDIIGGLVGSQDDNAVINASYATGDVDGGAGQRDRVGGLVGLHGEQAVIIASYATGTVDGGAGTTDFTGGLVGDHEGGAAIIASYATGTVDGGADDTDVVGGLVGRLRVRSSIIASYAAGNASGGTGTNDRVGTLLGNRFFDETVGRTPQSSYGFGTVSNAGRTGVSPVLPSGVTSSAGLTASNAVGCSDTISTTQTACESGTKTPGVWTVIIDNSGTCAAPSMDATDGVDYAILGLQATCIASTKSVGTWGPQWNTATFSTMGAWDFGTRAQAPVLRYADYDGAGTAYDCDMFPATVPGTTTPLICGTTLLPGQGR